MSFAKIPFIFLFGLGLHTLKSPINLAAPKEAERTIADSLLNFKLLAVVVSATEITYWVYSAIELAIILASAVPKSTLAESVLTLLLPGKDPSRIFLSPMGFLATTLMGIGAIIRFQCYREMGKQFTVRVTLLKDHKLITTGPYSYVRHPSYTGACMCLAGVAIWYTAQGSWLRESEIYKNPLAWLVLALEIVHIFMVIQLMFGRMPKEDEMMKKTFGKEWDEWARKIPDRLFPGIY